MRCDYCNPRPPRRTARKVAGVALLASPLVAVVVIVGVIYGVAGLLEAALGLLIAIAILGATLAGMRLLYPDLPVTLRKDHSDD